MMSAVHLYFENQLLLNSNGRELDDVEPNRQIQE